MENSNSKIIHKDLSYQLTGIFFSIHNKIGRFAREKQYGDLLESSLRDLKIDFEREKPIPVEGIDNGFTNKVDFDIKGIVLVDLKAKPIITKDDYYQMKRYLQASGRKLGLIVNFRNTYLKPVRVLHPHS